MGVLLQEKMAKPEATIRPVRKCCCGCSLLASCVVIGTFGLLNGISSLYVGLISLGNSRREHDYSLAVNVLTLLYGALHLATGLSLIYGADKRKTSLIKFWLYTRYVEVVLIIGAAVYFMVVYYMYWQLAAMILFIIFAFLVGIGIMVYCIAVVHSLVQDINEEAQRLTEEI